MNAKAFARTAAAFALHRSGARRGIAALRRMRAGGRRVVVVGYHRVCGDFEAERETSIESCLIGRETFRRHVAYLKENFEPVTMSRAVEALGGRDHGDGSREGGRDLAVITFDDGYRDLVDHALPVLREAGVPATLYVSSGIVDEGGWFPHDRLFSLLREWVRSPKMRDRAASWATRTVDEARAVRGGPPRFWLGHLIRTRGPDVLEALCAELSRATDTLALPPTGARALDWEGVRTLAAGGFEIGAHTIGHRVLPHLSSEEIERELSEAKAAIEREVGTPVRHFAYCNGYYDARVLEALRRTGYASAVTTEDRLNRHGQDPYRIGRRVLWEGSARGPGGRQSSSMLACQLDGTWTSLGFDASESGELVVPEAASAPPAPPERRLA